eukprot:15470257-Alexandrium_andersonii.AAC.1
MSPSPDLSPTAKGTATSEPPHLPSAEELNDPAQRKQALGTIGRKLCPRRSESSIPATQVTASQESQVDWNAPE